MRGVRIVLSGAAAAASRAVAWNAPRRGTSSSIASPTSTVSAANARCAPRQPACAPISVASGTPSTSENDCPVITQPSADPRRAGCDVIRDGGEDGAHEAAAADPAGQHPEHGRRVGARPAPIPPIAAPTSTIAPVRIALRPNRSRGRAGDQRGDAPGHRHRGHQVRDGHQISVQIVGHVEQERRPGRAAAGRQERAEGQRPEHQRHPAWGVAAALPSTRILFIPRPSVRSAGHRRENGTRGEETGASRTRQRGPWVHPTDRAHPVVAASASATRATTGAQTFGCSWRNRRTDGYHGESSRSSSQRQS